MSNTNGLFVIFGAAGFPYKKSAPANKYYFLSLALQQAGFDVILLNRLNSTNCKVQSKGASNGVQFCFLTLKNRKTLLSRIMGEIASLPKAISLLFRLQKKTKRRYIMVSYGSFYFVPYLLLSKVLGYKIIISIMEDPEYIAKSNFEKIKAKLFWKYWILIGHGYFPISKTLDLKLRFFKKNVRNFIIPALADFHHEGFLSNKTTNNKFFLFCASTGYSSVIELVIKSFANLHLNDVCLFLVLSGPEDNIIQYKQSTASYGNIKIYQDLENKDLYELYSMAIGLLLPIRPCLQDQARFPQKLAEYLASATPIVTNPYGVVNEFLTDKQNAVFAASYSVESYTDAMKWILTNPRESSVIGNNGRVFGLKNFHYETISINIGRFLDKL